MTDNEIIKDLEVEFDKIENALDLINRQKAEIERLQKAGDEAVSCFTRMESLYKIKCKELEVAKNEAVKEFAELIKKAFPSIAGAIDYFVKETVGGENAEE